MFDWNDLKAFLGVARGGSTLAASKALGVNQTTVARRVESLEQALGLKLFERGQSGSRLTEAGRDLVAEAEKVERAAQALHARAKAHQRGLTGAIRITCTEILANLSITPAIAHFRRQYPEVQVEMMITDQTLDIAAGEADIAIRSGQALPVSDLVARKLADHEHGLYCSRDYAARHGLPATPADLKDHELISCEGPGGRLPGIDWMIEQAGGKPPSHTCNTITNLTTAVKSGLGVAPLSCVLADADPDLVRVTGPLEAARSSTWLVTRRELKDTPRIRAFIDFLVPHVQAQLKGLDAQARRLRGETAANDSLLSRSLGLPQRD
jgi:DNA-binding transcriptional LysR family regulator